jgi:hypothetical protein
MNELKATPGSWRILGEDEPIENVPAIMIEGGPEAPHPKNKSVAAVESTLGDDNEFYLSSEDWANAHLIAASRDMYKDLEHYCDILGAIIVEALQDSHEYLDELKSGLLIEQGEKGPRIKCLSLSKARGES